MTEEKPARRKRTTTPKPKTVSKPAPEKAPEGSREFRRRLSQGDHGPTVQFVQQRLTSLGYWEGPDTGRFGMMLARAVRRFQGDNNLRITGDVDIKTWEAMVL